MSIITSVTAQKNKRRVNIFLDGEYSFSLDLDNFGQLGLKVGKELNQEEVSEIVKKSEFQKAFDKTLNFATRRLRSQKEIADYFRRKEIDISIHQIIIDRLKRLELLDDQKFAKWWVEQRLRFKNKSKKDITFELRQKGIDNQTIKNVLDDSEIDELKIAKELIKKKYYKWKKYDGGDKSHEKIRNQKIAQYLSGKGFSWEIINSVIDINQ